MTNTTSPNKSTEHPFTELPDEGGHFGIYGGVFVAETLIQPLEELKQAYNHYIKNDEFIAELDSDLEIPSNFVVGL